MGKNRTKKFLEVIDQMEEVLGLYGAVIYRLANDNEQKAIIAAVGKADAMIDELRKDIEGGLS